MKLKDKVDALIIVPNDRIFNIISKDTPILKAFEAIDEVLRNALKGLVEIIAMPGIINVDFADVKNIMADAGVVIVGVGDASGANRAMDAVNMALHSPLLETSPEGAKAVLLGISGGRDLKMTEINEAAKLVAQTADPGARIIFGAYYDKNLKPNQVKITIIASGFNGGTASPRCFSARTAAISAIGIWYSVADLPRARYRREKNICFCHCTRRKRRRRADFAGIRRKRIFAAFFRECRPKTTLAEEARKIAKDVQGDSDGRDKDKDKEDDAKIHGIFRHSYEGGRNTRMIESRKEIYGSARWARAFNRGSSSFRRDKAYRYLLRYGGSCV